MIDFKLIGSVFILSMAWFMILGPLLYRVLIDTERSDYNECWASSFFITVIGLASCLVVFLIYSSLLYIIKYCA